MSADPTGNGDRGLTGTVWTAPAGPTASPPARSRLLTPAVGASLVILLVSAASSVTWAIANGGVALPPRASAPAVAGASIAPAAGTSGPGEPSPAPFRTPVAAGPTTAPPSRAPALAATPAPSPTSDRYALLVACPDVPDCYRYTVRAGDNLWSIARWFGVPLDVVYERNPELRTATLRPGTQIVLPAPTR